jgi:hypothetical protein
MNQHLQRLWWRAVRQFGAPGLIALFLLVPALAIGLAIPTLTRHSDELRVTLVARAEELSKREQPVRRRMSAGEQVGEFVAGFPPLSQCAADLEQVFAAAAQRKVTLPKGDYLLKAEPNSPLVTFTATFPVRNEYGALKAFTADVLTTLPHVSMDELRMTRSDAGSGTLDSVVRFTFVYRSP